MSCFSKAPVEDNPYEDWPDGQDPAQAPQVIVESSATEVAASAPPLAVSVPPEEQPAVAEAPVDEPEDDTETNPGIPPTKSEIGESV